MAIVAMALVRAGLGGEVLSQFAVLLLVVVIGLAEWPISRAWHASAVLVEATSDYAGAARAALGDSDWTILRRRYSAQQSVAAHHRRDYAAALRAPSWLEAALSSASA